MPALPTLRLPVRRGRPPHGRAPGRGALLMPAPGAPCAAGLRPARPRRPQLGGLARPHARPCQRGSAPRRGRPRRRSKVRARAAPRARAQDVVRLLRTCAFLRYRDVALMEAVERQARAPAPPQPPLSERRRAAPAAPAAACAARLPAERSGAAPPVEHPARGDGAPPRTRLGVSACAAFVQAL